MNIRFDEEIGHFRDVEWFDKTQSEKRDIQQRSYCREWGEQRL